MSNPWFRFYVSVPDDPKVQRLKPDLFKSWVNLLCLAARNDGVLPSVEDISFSLRMSSDKVRSVLHELQRLELIDADDGQLAPHNWKNRQFKSDLDNTATERKRRQRGRAKGQVPVNVTRDVTDKSHPPEQNRADTEQNTEQNTEQKNGAAAPAHVFMDDLRKAQGLWNDMARQHGLSLVEVLTRKRMDHLKARLRECGGLDGWTRAMELVPQSQFLLGENDRGWKADFDFILQQKSFTRLMEGTYGNRAQPTNAKPNTLAAGFAELDRVTDQFIREQGGLREDISEEAPRLLP